MNKQAITITDAARRHIEDLLIQNPGQHLRISINSRGCSGHKYQYDLKPWDSAAAYDETIDWPGGRVVLDASSLLGMIGSVLDLHSDRFGSQLTWHNPMAFNHCGCGESFQLDWTQTAA
jgi:iron-sulfur cluster assembly accessory protein